ncbi:hypothetical protein DFJ74DRAFT_701887 [Hyaloraphidium curvatum]|nr:hypothetical protein DFJ74DRAFT_701887 [Hyaloraphidium curvatum]
MDTGPPARSQDCLSPEAADECLLHNCEDLKRECCQALGGLLKKLSAQPGAVALTALDDPSLDLRKGTKDDADSQGSNVPRKRGGLKKNPTTAAADFAFDDVSLTLAVATLLKGLYEALESCAGSAHEVREASQSGKAEAERLVSMLVHKDRKLDLNEFMSIKAAAKGSDDSEYGPPEASLGDAAMTPLRANIRALDFEQMSPEKKRLWSEVDKSISLVLSTVERRVLQIVPKLENQCVFLTDRQQRIMDSAQVAAAINRMLQFGRMDGQRVRFEDTRYSKLNDLIQGIEQAGQRSLASQRAELSQTQQNKMEISRVQRAIERGSRGRMGDQEFFAREAKLMDIIASLRLDREGGGKMDQQSYLMSEQKEREMFAIQIGSKMARLRRMSAQTTWSVEDRDRIAMEKLEQVFDSVMSKTVLHTQRAGNRPAM